MGTSDLTKFPAGRERTNDNSTSAIDDDELDDYLAALDSFGLPDGKGAGLTAIGRVAPVANGAGLKELGRVAVAAENESASQPLLSTG